MASLAVLVTVPDEDLVRRCCQGESDAFAVIYGRYRRRVLMTANRIIRDPEDAQDATQEIFLKAWISLWQWNPGKSRLSTWLYRLAANHAIDCWRARRRRATTGLANEVSTEGLPPEFAADAREAPDRELERKEEHSELCRYVSRLPRLQRRMFVLRHFHGLSLNEIARREGRSLGTVKGSLHRATRAMGSGSALQWRKAGGTGGRTEATPCRY